MTSAKHPQARRHHIVPRFHLRRFADARGLLTRVELPGRRHPVSVRNAAVERDFYMVQADDGTETDKFEKWLSSIEALGARATQRIIDDEIWPPTTEDQWSIAIWAAIQHLRTSATRRVVEDVADHTFKLDMAVGGKPRIRKILEAQSDAPVTDAEVEEAWHAISSFDSYRVVPHRNDHLQLILDNALGTAQTFVARSWKLVRFQRRSLVTSDQPVVLVPGPDHPKWMGVGIVTAGTVVLPLDRRVLLLMGNIGDDDAVWQGTTRLARDAIELVATNARRSVFHHPDDADILNGVELPQPREYEIDVGDSLERFMAPDGWPPRAESGESPQEPRA